MEKKMNLDCTKLTRQQVLDVAADYKKHNAHSVAVVVCPRQPMAELEQSFPFSDLVDYVAGDHKDCLVGDNHEHKQKQQLILVIDQDGMKREHQFTIANIISREDTNVQYAAGAPCVAFSMPPHLTVLLCGKTPDPWRLLLQNRLVEIATVDELKHQLLV